MPIAGMLLTMNSQRVIWANGLRGPVTDARYLCDRLRTCRFACRPGA
jgi:hypothetical protein